MWRWEKAKFVKLKLQQGCFPGANKATPELSRFLSSFPPRSSHHEGHAWKKRRVTDAQTLTSGAGITYSCPKSLIRRKKEPKFREWPCVEEREGISWRRKETLGERKELFSYASFLFPSYMPKKWKRVCQSKISACICILAYSFARVIRQRVNLASVVCDV